MNTTRPHIRLAPPPRPLPNNVVVLPLESTIPPEMTIDEWRYRNVASIAKRRARRKFFTRPAREAA
jgi:hypothetical protein